MKINNIIIIKFDVHSGSPLLIVDFLKVGPVQVNVSARGL